MAFSFFNSVMNKASSASSMTGTASQVLKGLQNPDPLQGISGILTATAGRSKLARKLLTLDSKIKDIMTKFGGMADTFRGPKPPTKVWDEDPNGPLRKMEGRPDPQLGIDWYAEVVSPFADDDIIPSIYIEQINTPSLTIAIREVFREGTVRKYVDGVSVGNINVTFYLDIEGTARKFLYSWLNAQYSNYYGTYTGAFEYKKQIVISVNDPSGTTTARAVLGGCFITEINSEEYVPGSSEPVKLSATLSVDTFECISVLDDNVSAKSSMLKQLSASDYRNVLPTNNSLLSMIPSKFTNGISTGVSSAVSSAQKSLETAGAAASSKLRSLF